MVRRGRGLQAVDRLGDDRHRRIEAEGGVGGAEIVVDGLGHADHADPERREALRDMHRAVATDHHEPVQSGLAHALERALRHVGDRDRPVVTARRKVPRVALVGRAEHRAALGDQPGDVAIAQLAQPALVQSLEAVLDPDDRRAESADSGTRDRADHRVQAWAVPAAGEQADP
jgi:hypothetical protein